MTTIVLCLRERTNKLFLNNNSDKSYGAVRSNKLKMNRKINLSNRLECISGKSQSYVTEQCEKHLQYNVLCQIRKRPLEYFMTFYSSQKDKFDMTMMKWVPSVFLILLQMKSNHSFLWFRNDVNPLYLWGCFSQYPIWTSHNFKFSRLWTKNNCHGYCCGFFTLTKSKVRYRTTLIGN